jgi:FixJ family two-component response regulator
MSKGPLVSVVDDDESVRESLPDLLREFGYSAKAFASAEEYLASGYVEKTGCLIADIAMPGMSGPELQSELKRRQHHLPIIFITAHGLERIRGHLMGRGAVACLSKPFSDETLFEALKTGFGTKSRS